jgi:ABC-type spermidine/putrescine transport system permease subunit I
MKPTAKSFLLLVPGLVFLVALLFVPLALLVQESLRPYIPGRIGGAVDAGYTLAHYIQITAPAYLFYFFDTFRIGLIVSALGVLLGYPIAYHAARTPHARIRHLWIAFLVCMLFLSIIVRVYSILLTYGPVGALSGIAVLFGTTSASPRFAEIQVIIGLLHVIIPLVALTLIGAIQNVNPTLELAAQSLGAPRWKAFFRITLALSVPGIASSFLIAYAFCISNFVVPLVLGKGIVLFVSNLIYIRFSEVNNYPSGAAISIVMLLLSIVLVYGLLQLVQRRWAT